MAFQVDTAAAYLGKRIFPLMRADYNDENPRNPGKMPLITGWQKVEFKFTKQHLDLWNREGFLNWRTNKVEACELGWALDKDDFVIDVDVKNNAPGLASLEKLSDDCGFDVFEDAAVVVKSPTGGYHLYYKKPEDFPIWKNPRDENGNQKYPGIDFLSGGSTVQNKGACYVVTAGSQHKNGGFYSFEKDKDNFFFIDSAGSVLLGMVELQNPSSRDLDIPDVFDDAEIDIKRGEQYLASCEPAIEGAGGDNTTFQTACKMRDLGLKEETALGLMYEHYNPRCEPPWDGQELATKVKNAYNHASGQAGSQSGAHTFEPVVQQANLPATNVQIEDNTPIFVEDRPEIQPYNWREFLETSPNGKTLEPKATLFNLQLYCTFKEELTGLFAFDEFKSMHALIKDGLPPTWMPKKFQWPQSGVIEIDKNVHLLIRKHILNSEGVSYSLSAIEEMVDTIALMNWNHPIRNYLDSLVWDGNPRIETLFHRFFGVENNPYSRATGRKFFTAAVKRVFEPGCKFDYMLIFEGEQGLGKSTFFKALTGKEWFCEVTGNLQNENQVEENLRGKWIAEFSEMDSFSKADSTRCKAFISRDTDRFRTPYQPLSRDHPRQIVFYGTTNEEQYLKDTSGNRRYWPLRVNSKYSIGPKYMELEAVKIKDQVWAEAKHLYNLHKADPMAHTLFMEGEEEVFAVQEQKKRQEHDLWEEPILAFMNGKNVDKKVYDMCPVSKICEGALGLQKSQITRPDQNRVGRLVQKLGFRKSSRYYKGYGNVQCAFRETPLEEYEKEAMLKEWEYDENS